MAEPEKLVFILTHGPEDPERATLPFVMGCAALASDVEVVLTFQGEGVRLVLDGIAEKVEAPGFPPLVDLLAMYQELGGELLACSPCLKNRELPREGLVEGCEVISAARLVAELTSATNSLVY